MATFTTPVGGTAQLLLAADVAQLAISGAQFSSVVWVVATAGNGGITAEYSKDGGANWLTPPQSVNISAVSASPSTAPWANNTPVAGTYETPLPANATHFRIRHQTAGTLTVINIGPGKSYVRGGVSATLFDTTSAVNTAIDTSILDVSGWETLCVYFVTPAGGSGTIKPVDDGGTALTLHTVPASATTMIVLSPAGPTNVAAVATGGTVSIGLRAKRVQLTSAQVAALTSRIRIEAFR